MLQSLKQYELLNYSSHGTVVDDVLYSCDITEKPYNRERTTPDEAGDARDAIRDALRKTKCMSSPNNEV